MARLESIEKTGSLNWVSFLNATGSSGTDHSLNMRWDSDVFFPLNFTRDPA